MPTAKCPACGLNLGGVPETRRVLVTCPSARGGCGAKFFHPATERSTISLRCAHDGRHFAAFFKRDPPSRKFRIDRLAPLAANSNGDGPGATDAYNADAYEFTGFYCPCCGYVPTDEYDCNIVQCSKCSGLVCGSLVHPRQDGTGAMVRWFVCHPECGHEGPITRPIQEYQASRSITVERVAAGHLPSPGPAPLKIAKG